MDEPKQGTAAGVIDRLTSVVLRHPVWIVLAFVAACAVAMTVHTRSANYDLSYRTMAPRHTPEFLQFEEFIETFGDNSDTFVIGFRDEPLITVTNLEMIERITQRIEAMGDTVTVISLVNVLDILGRDDALDVTEFIETMPPPIDSLADLAQRLIADPIVGGGLISADGSMAAIQVRLLDDDVSSDEQFAYFDEVRRLLDEEGKGRVQFYMAGYPYLLDVIMRYMVDDSARFMPLTMLIMGGLLWVMFGRFRSVWLPLIPVVIATTLILGALTGSGLSMSLLTGQGVLTTLILVMGLSNGVHFLNRYEEDLLSRPDEDRGLVLRETNRHIGLACSITSLTTGIGFLSLSLADVTTVRDFGIFGALGIFFSLIGAIMLMPALLVLIERRKPQVPRETNALQWVDRLLAGSADFVVRRSGMIIVGSVALLLSAAALIPSARIDNRAASDLKSNDPAILALDFFEDSLGGAYPLDIVARGSSPDAMKDPALLAELDFIARGLEELPWISKVTSPTTFIKKMNRAMSDGAEEEYRLPDSSQAVAQYLLLFEMAGSDGEFDRLVNYDYSALRMTALLADISAVEFEEILAEIDRLKAGRLPPGVDVYASGESPVWRSASQVLITTLVRSLYLAMPLIFIIIGLTFGSLRIGLLSVLPNVLPITIGLGLLDPLDVTLRFSTIVAFPVAFGLAVDDTIHFLARYRGELAAGKSPEDAVRTTIATTGRAMLLTSLLLIAGFSVLFFSNFLGLVHVALLICIILAAALIGDVLLLPALLLRFGPDSSHRFAGAKQRP